MSSASHETFRVLTVCTANQFRSPLAEFHLRRSVAMLGFDWVVESAGTRAEDGLPVHPFVAAIMAGHSWPIGEWTSHALTAQAIARSNLILAADHTHRAAVVAMVPSALPRTFLLNQFARLAVHRFAVGTDGRGGPALLARVTLARGEVQPVPDSIDDIADPAGKSRRALQRCADEVERAVARMMSAPQLGGPPSAG